MVVAIVAIPAADEPVWNISSEKVPHLTILTLGESVEDPAGITQYVQHTVEHTMERFGLTVDRRGLLGDKDADVLFFEKTPWGFETVKRLRDNLLRDNDILRGYITSPQFEGWTPHLTLGYPDKPAKKDPEDRYGLSYINFDRIAIWFENYEGPEFLIPRQHDSVMAMGAELENFLAHHGVKGMKWGVRKDLDAVARTSLSNPGPLTVRADKKIKPEELQQMAMAAHGVRHSMLLTDRKAVAKIMNKVDSKYDPMDLAQNPATVRKYDLEMSRALTKFAQTKIPEGAEARVRVDGDNWDLYVGTSLWVKQYYDDEIFHSEEGIHLSLRVIRDENNFIVRFEDSAVSHSDVNDFLAHHGIKGMRWGVRRTDAQLGNPDGGKNGVKDKDGVDENLSKMAKGSHPADKSGLEIDNPRDVQISEDAIRFVRTRLKEGHEMSDREIVEAINRARNVEQYQKMFMPDPNQQLKTRLEQLETQKKIAQIESEMTPAQKTAVDRLVGASKASFSAFQAIDKVTGNALSNKLKDVVGDALTDPKLKVAKALAEKEAEEAKKRSEKRKEDTDEAKLKKAQAEADAASRKNEESAAQSARRERATAARQEARQAKDRAADAADNAKAARAEVKRYEKIAADRDRARRDPNLSPAQRKKAEDEFQAAVREAGRQKKLAKDYGQSEKENERQARDLNQEADDNLKHDEEFNNFLMHYGVKGMKWGVRRPGLSATVAEVSSRAKRLDTSKILENSKKFAKDPAVQKRVATSLAITGSAAVATMLAGPIGGMAVSAVGRGLTTAFPIDQTD